MNKKIKTVLMSLLLISSLTIYSPINFNPLMAKAYADASTYSMADDGELKSLDVQSTNGQSLELCDAYSGDAKNLTDSLEYYVTLDGNSDGVKVSAGVQGDGYFAKVYDSKNDSATPHELGENITILPGESSIYIRTYATEADYKKAIKDKEASFCAKTYKINIQKAMAGDTEDLGLETLTLDGGNVPISFNKNTLNYNIQVSEDQDDVQIKVRADNDKDTVKVQGFTLDEDNKYKKDIHLLYGLNVLKIVVTDSGNRIKTYTLNITRGKTSSSTASTVNNTSGNNTAITTTMGQGNAGTKIKANQWVNVNGVWNYNDSNGNTLKNTWFWDRNLGRYYYFKSDGAMAVNWLSINGNWYYLGSDGAMKTGWQYINEKYYYMQSLDGAMVKNTQIDGYKLGEDGAWVE